MLTLDLPHSTLEGIMTQIIDLYKLAEKTKSKSLCELLNCWTKDFETWTVDGGKMCNLDYYLYRARLHANFTLFCPEQLDVNMARVAQSFAAFSARTKPNAEIVMPIK